MYYLAYSAYKHMLSINQYLPVDEIHTCQRVICLCGEVVIVMWVAGWGGWVGRSRRRATRHWPPGDTEGALGYLDKSKPLYVFFYCSTFPTLKWRNVSPNTPFFASIDQYRICYAKGKKDFCKSHFFGGANIFTNPLLSRFLSCSDDTFSIRCGSDYCVMYCFGYFELGKRQNE